MNYALNVNNLSKKRSKLNKSMLNGKNAFARFLAKWKTSSNSPLLGKNLDTTYEALRAFMPWASHLAPRTSHLAPRTSHLAPRTSHLDFRL
ncbi:hypothetical protein VV208B2_02840 [Vibrio vulnificus]|nr:hypothetical protein VV208B2_02840 [Vibrio vulnificus]